MATQAAILTLKLEGSGSCADRPVSNGFNLPEYSTITHVSLEVANHDFARLEVRIYGISMDDGGTFTGLSAICGG